MNPLVIAHRGGAAEAPENTMEAFGRALEAGADGVECDVHLSSDGVVFVHHDQEVVLEPGAAPTPIAAVRSDRLATLDLGWTHGERFTGLRLPRLDEVIDLVGDRWLMVELKRGPDDAALGEAVAVALGQRVGRDRMVLASFSVEALRAARCVAGPLLMMGVAREPSDIAAQEDLDLWAQGLIRDLVPGPAARKARDRGRRVWAWTIDAVEQIPSLVAEGVDALIADVPAAAVHFLAEAHSNR